MEEKENINRIGQDFDFWGLLGFVFPSMLTNVVQQLFKTLDDGLFVSRFVGKTALAGINILGPLHFLQFSLNNLFAVGGANISSKCMGEGKQLEAKQVFSRIVISAAVIGFAVALFFNIFASPVLTFLGADAELYEYALLSLRTVFMITPISLINVIFNSYFSTAGKPSLGLICSIVNGAVNIIMDVLLIVVLKLGVLGACLSTMLGEIIIFIIGIVFFFDKRNEIHFVAPEGNIIPTTIETWKYGLPQFINTFFLSITTFITNRQLLAYIGNDGIAANSIIGDLRRILTALFFGYIIAFGPILSYHFGAQNRPRMRKLMRQNMIFWFGGSIILTITGLLLRNPMISIFIKSGENTADFYAITYYGLTAELLGIAFFSWNIILSRLFTAINLQRASSVHAIIRNIVIRVITLAALPPLLGWRGILLANPVCEVLSMIAGIVIYRKKMKSFEYNNLF